MNNRSNRKTLLATIFIAGLTAAAKRMGRIFL